MFRSLVYGVAAVIFNALIVSVVLMTTDLGPLAAVWLGALATIAIVVPVVLLDAARLSNLVLGQFIRVQGAIRRLAASDPVGEIRVREDDIWKDWIQEFNAMLVNVQQRDRQQSVQEDWARQS